MATSALQNASTRFRESSHTLAANLEAAISGDKHNISDSLLLVMKLKASSRAKHLAVDQQRQLVLDEKKSLDARHLQLQNLLYRKAHLLRELKLCHDFRYLITSQSFPLSCFSQFRCSSFSTSELRVVERDESCTIIADGEDLAVPELHQKRLQILSEEMEERKRLEQSLLVRPIFPDPETCSPSLTQLRKFNCCP